MISLKDVVERTSTAEERKDLDHWEIYGFHSKWNLQDDRLIFTVRRFPKDHPRRFGALHDQACRFDVYMMREEGSELYNAVASPLWIHGGHHINWFPDG